VKPPPPAVKKSVEPKPVEQVTPRPPQTQPPPSTKTPATTPNPSVQLPSGADVASPSAVPLGLRYSVLKAASDGRYQEVDADSIFRAGDRIRFSVTANDSGYLYIVQRGSTGNWRVMFPSADIEDGNNRVMNRREYMFPPGGRFTFDQNTGDVKIFLILSRAPEPNLEKLIYDLNAPAKPAAAPNAGSKHLMIAANRPPIDDAIIGRVRSTVMARDLVFEKVDDKTVGERKEQAIYVVNVNTAAAAEQRLVVDLTLRHQ
jgi:hypothetical protein